MIDEARFKNGMRRWIAQANGKVGPADFDDDSPLIQLRIITSLQIMDLILYVEELTGRPVDVEQLQPGSFHSVNAIYRTFGGPEREA